MEKIEVTGCKDCPLCSIYEEDYFCEHPIHNLGELLLADDDGPVTPSNCPLYKSQITISIKQDNG